MKSFDTYGWADSRLDALRQAIEDALSIKFQAHESAYRGGDYFRSGDSRHEHLILQRTQSLTTN